MCIKLENITDYDSFLKHTNDTKVMTIHTITTNNIKNIKNIKYFY